MEKIKSLPPNYELIIASGLKPDENTVFAYGNKIYNPSGKELTADIEHHESIHSKQQGENPEAWWYRYLTDNEFRFSQELEAYGEQYAFAKKHIKNNRLLKWGLEKMAIALSGEIYGINISYGEAESKIRNFNK